jgi:hypothetical protein
MDFVDAFSQALNNFLPLLLAACGLLFGVACFFNIERLKGNPATLHKFLVGTFVVFGIAVFVWISKWVGILFFGIALVLMWFLNVVF